MKRFKIAMIALFALVVYSNVNAQDSNNPWAISFGVNGVDLYGNNGLGTQMEDLIGTSDWNMLSSISNISVERYLEDGVSLRFGGTLNKITQNGLDGELYYSLDVAAKYNLDLLVEKLFKSSTPYFQPFVYLGGSYVSLGDASEGMVNFGAGFNTWFNDNFGITVSTGSKNGFNDEIQNHFQTTLGLIFKFGGKDTDGDGIYDKEDSCPDVAGLAAFNGCPDADGDGVEDSKDSCPNVAGLASLNGCPDADADGIADKNDMCPNEKGSKANNGCPDSDNDGVINKDDKCPNVAGPTANGGCPWPDTDGDGVLDKDDNCVSEAGPASNNGCPEPVITEEAVKTIDMEAKSILFNTGRISFKKGVTKDLDDIVAVMNEFPRATFAIGGHTDSVGSATTNTKLSQKRADAVMKYFVSKGIDASRLSAKGYGEDTPIDSNKTRAGRANNRRVEIKVSNL